MIALKIIRALFPASFQHQHGDEWESLAEDILAAARSRGWLALVGVWLGLVWDTGLRAPLAHARQWRLAIVGQPPQLAGAGLWGATSLIGQHWVVRPAKSILRTFYRYAAVFICGAGAAFLLHAWLAQDAALAALAVADHALAVVDHFAAGLDYPLNQRAFLIAFLFIALTVSPRLAKKWWKAWNRSGFGVISPLVVFFLGFILALQALISSSLTSQARDGVAMFLAYSQYRGFPAAEPYRDMPIEDWAPEQIQWFNLHSRKASLSLSQKSSSSGAPFGSRCWRRSAYKSRRVSA